MLNARNRVKRATFSAKTTLAITCRPLNWYGRVYNKIETMPVPMLTLNQLGVKLSVMRVSSRRVRAESDVEAACGTVDDGDGEGGDAATAADEGDAGDEDDPAIAVGVGATVAATDLAAIVI